MNIIKSTILFALGPALWLGAQAYDDTFHHKPEGWVEWRLTLCSLLTLSVYGLLLKKIAVVYPDSLLTTLLTVLIALNIIMAFVSLLFLYHHLRNKN